MRARRFGTLIGLLLLCAVLWVLTPHFLTVSNLLNVAQQTCINAIVAVGMTFVIISGGIDLSVGSIVAFSGVVMASCCNAVPSPWRWRRRSPRASAAGCSTARWSAGQAAAVHRDARHDERRARRGVGLHRGRPVSGFNEGFRWLATGMSVRSGAGDRDGHRVLVCALHSATNSIWALRFCHWWKRRGRSALRRKGAVSQDRGLLRRWIAERAGCRRAYRPIEFGATDRRHQLRARCHRGHGDRRHELDGREGSLSER